MSIPEGSEESDTDQIPVRDEPVGIKSKLAKVLISKVKDEAVGVPAKEFNKYTSNPEKVKEERIQIISKTQDLELEATNDEKVLELPLL